MKLIDLLLKDPRKKNTPSPHGRGGMDKWIREENFDQKAK